MTILARLWRGEVQLTITFWLMLIAHVAISLMLRATLIFLHWTRIKSQPTELMILFLAASGYVFGLVSIFRSAKTNEEHLIYKYLAFAVVLILAFFTLFELASAFSFIAHKEHYLFP